MKKNYYVQVTTIYKATDEKGITTFFNEKNYVTELNYQTKTARWEKGKKPLKMSKREAEDIAEGLIMNFHSAQIVITFWELDENDNLEGGNHNE